MFKTLMSASKLSCLDIFVLFILLRFSIHLKYVSSQQDILGETSYTARVVLLNMH